MNKMVNDTTTLNGALMELGDTMASNLNTKGVQTSSSDGLTTLANKILDIEQKSDMVILYSHKKILSFADEDSVTFIAVLSTLQTGQTVALYDEYDNFLGNMTDNDDGTYSYEYISAGIGNVGFYAKWGSIQSENYIIWDVSLTSSNMSISNDGNKITLKNDVTGYAETQINNLNNVPPTDMVIEFDSYAPNQTRNSESIGLCVYGDSNTRTFILHNQNEFGNKELTWADYGPIGYQRYDIELKERWLHNKFIFQNNSMTYELYYGDTLLASKGFNLNSALLNSNNFSYTFICPWTANGERYIKNFKITNLS